MGPAADVRSTRRPGTLLFLPSVPSDATAVLTRGTASGRRFPRVREDAGRALCRERQRRSLASLAALPPPRAVYRNPDAVPYCACTFLDPIDRWAAAVDVRGRLDLVRVPSANGGGNCDDSVEGDASPSPPVGSLRQRVSVAPPAGHCHLRSVQRGEALAVGTPTGDFRVLATERASDGPRWSQPRRPTRGRARPPDASSAPSLSLLLPPSSGAFWTSSWVGHRPQRRYAPSRDWTLREQALRLPPGNHGRCSDEDDEYDRTWCLEEISGWNARDSSSSSATVGFDCWSPCGGGGAARGAAVREWDFLETPSTLLAAHVGVDYVGVKLMDDRLDRSHVLLLDENKENKNKASSTPVAAVAFATPDGLLLATRGPSFSDDAVLLWDLRHTRHPTSAVVLPSFPRDAAHCLDSPVDSLAAADRCWRQHRGSGGHPHHFRGLTVELPALEYCGDDVSVGVEEEVDPDCCSRLVSLSALECALLCHKLQPPGPPLALHRDGWAAQAVFSDSHGGSSLRLWDVEQGLRESLAVHRHPPAGSKRAADGTLRRMFDGGAGREEHAAAAGLQVKDEEDVENSHRRGADGARRTSGNLHIPLQLEDRYGCTTSLSCLAFDEVGGRILGGTCDGDLFVFG